MGQDAGLLCVQSRYYEQRRYVEQTDKNPDESFCHQYVAKLNKSI